MIPKCWRKAKVIAVLKPGKDPKQGSSYRPLSMLSVGYKLYMKDYYYTSDLAQFWTNNCQQVELASGQAGAVMSKFSVSRHM